jgi:methylthioribose-1-phosphate isomerase
MHVWWRVVVDKDREPNAIKPQRTHLLFYPRPIRDKLKSMIPTLEWLPEGVNFLDQTKLPLEETYVLATDYKQVAVVIKDMIVRGAMAIGVSAAMGVALGIDRSTAANLPALTAEVDLICKTLAETRPTAVNLFWGIAQVRNLYTALAARNTPIPDIKRQAVALALRLYDEDIANLRTLGNFGAELLPQEGTILTHCNAGALAACGYGSALGVIRAAIEHGKKIDVFADETRPFNQGARLTAWELMKDGIPTTIICDNMAGHFMFKGRIQAVIVGADRIAANGDTANKIGTYSVAILAREHGIPFYVAAPFNTIDPETASGDLIPIEQRSAREVTHVNGRQVTPHGVAIENPAFDVTPAKYITAIVTERGVLRAPYKQSIRAVATANQTELATA